MVYAEDVEKINTVEIYFKVAESGNNQLKFIKLHFSRMFSLRHPISNYIILI